MTCAHCGCAITAELQKGHHYYRCTKRKRRCASPYVREEALAEQLRDSVRRGSLSDDWAEKWLRQVEEWEQADRQHSAVLSERRKAQLGELQARLSRLLDVYLEGAITRDEYTARKEGLVREKTALEDESARTDRGEGGRFELLRKFINDAQDARNVSESE
ncbi:MAG: zinc ribbon domain-containing protein, partial [Kiritimatiellae bacterium]|nr:zinc ribbon domain-containing protein [Kiritimatiellia bacterium]